MLLVKKSKVNKSILKKCGYPQKFKMKTTQEITQQLHKKIWKATVAKIATTQKKLPKIPIQHYLTVLNKNAVNGKKVQWYVIQHYSKSFVIISTGQRIGKQKCLKMLIHKPRTWIPAPQKLIFQYFQRFSTSRKCLKSEHF